MHAVLEAYRPMAVCLQWRFADAPPPAGVTLDAAFGGKRTPICREYAAPVCRSQLAPSERASEIVEDPANCRDQSPGFFQRLRDRPVIGSAPRPSADRGPLVILEPGRRRVPLRGHKHVITPLRELRGGGCRRVPEFSPAAKNHRHRFAHMAGSPSPSYSARFSLHEAAGICPFPCRGFVAPLPTDFAEVRSMPS